MGIRILTIVLILVTACAESPDQNDRAGIEGTQPNVILVTFCTMRADRFGAYGGGDLTPTIDGLASEGFVFRNHYTQASFSGASFASIITGKYPFGHGIYDHPRRLSGDNVTLAEMFRQAGYATGGFLTHPYLRPKWNYLQGLDTYNGYKLDRNASFNWSRQPTGRTAAQVTRALKWVSGLDDRPYFIWFQTHLSHYFPRGMERWVSEADLASARAFKERTNHLTTAERMFSFDSLGVSAEEEKGLVAAYDGAVAQSDRLLGRLLAGLQEMGRYTNTIVLVTADHGETLGEKGLFFNHDSNLLEPSIHIPLVMLIPGGRSGEIEATSRSIDVMPTLAALAGLELPSGIHGQSLIPLLDGEAMDLPVFSETRPKDKHRREFDRYRLLVPGVEGKIRSIRRGKHKLTLYPTPDGYELELYDLETDPMESTNLAEEVPELAKGLAWRLEEWFSNYDQADVAPLDLDEEDLDSLRALGYID